MKIRFLSSFFVLSFIGFIFSGCGIANSSQKPSTASRFASPAEAVEALRVAVESHSVEKAKDLFGAEGEFILHSGDPVQDKNKAQKFVQLFQESHELEKSSDQRYVLTIGKTDWPFPVPLVSGKDGWYFDADAGREEILTRQIGANELSAIDICRTIYAAQRVYASTDPDQDGKFLYAERLISTSGEKDGLYWPSEGDESESPLGPAIVKALDEHYEFAADNAPQPYRGYYFRLFSTPPTAAVRTDAVKTDALSKPGTYWVIATPAVWGVSGLTTFAVNERGWIYEKDLGDDEPGSPLSAPIIDKTWTRIE